jgi:hypothetical protein
MPSTAALVKDTCSTSNGKAILVHKGSFLNSVSEARKSIIPER